MSDFEERQFFQRLQQRFEAALRFAIVRGSDGYSYNYKEAVEHADDLLKELDKTK